MTEFKLDPGYVLFNYNYYIKGNHAYTEDDVLVHKLFVYKLPRQARVADVREYFSRFGHIEDVRIVIIKRDRRSMPPNVAFVHFESPLDAAKALLVEAHYILGDRVFLKVCDSWHQPNAANNYLPLRSSKHNKKKRLVADEDMSLNIYVPPPKRDSILCLNDYCLDNIIQRLPLRSQISFARTCTRIHQVYKMTSKLLHRTFSLESFSEMTLWEIRDFLDFAGEYITRIEGEFREKHRLRIIELLGTYCKNVKELHLESVTMPMNAWKNLFCALPNVTYVYLHYCSLNDRCVLAMRKLKKLQTLNLIENYKISGKHLHTLPRTLEILSLKDCTAIQKTHMESFCKQLINLKELNIEQCFCISDIDFQCMVQACQNLETLTFSLVNSNYELVAKLPKLKNLTIHVTSRQVHVRPTLFTELAKHKSEQLEYLCIKGINCVTDENAQQISHLKVLRTLICPNNDELSISGLKFFCNHENLEEIVLRDCRKVCNSSLLRLALKCHTLKRIHVQRCQLVSDSLIFELIQGMRKQIHNNTFKRKKPIELMVEATKINKFILNDPDYLASAHLVVVFIKNIPQDILSFDDFIFGQDFDVDDDDELDFDVDIEDIMPLEQEEPDLFANDFIFSNESSDNSDDDFVGNVITIDGRVNQRVIPG